MKIINIILALAIPFSVNAAVLFENLPLAKKSHQLAISIKELSNIETVQFCKEKTSEASQYTEIAAERFMSNSNNVAKISLEYALQALRYTAVEDCSQEQNINLSIIELQKIYNAA